MYNVVVSQGAIQQYGIFDGHYGIMITLPEEGGRIGWRDLPFHALCRFRCRITQTAAQKAAARSGLAGGAHGHDGIA